MTDNTAIRPFHVGFPEAELTELNRRKNDPLARPRTGCRYNTRRAARDNTGARTVLGERLRLAQCEAKLAALPNFITEIDGLDIHFIMSVPNMTTRCR